MSPRPSPGQDRPLGTEEESLQAKKSIDELFEQYHTRVATWCLRLTGDRESAADLAQEVFLKAYRHLGSFRGGSKFSTWLYSITRNHCFNHLRACSRRSAEVGEECLPEISDDSSERLLDALERERTKRRVRELLNRVLDEVERQVMILHYVEELPLDSITRLLALENPSGARAYIVSAKRKLKRAVERSRAAGSSE